jgi:hypothetical protein
LNEGEPKARVQKPAVRFIYDATLYKDMSETKEILKELKGIRSDLNFIKTHLKNSDVLLTDDDIESLHEAEKDLKKRKTKRLI